MPQALAPIFVLCCARSGSTLLRYILDAHPLIAAPPELHLLLAARRLAWVLEHTASVPGNARDTIDAKRYAADRTRQILSAIMREHADRAGKTAWVEKSVSSLDCVDMLDVLFPEARIVFLYRRAPDVMASCAQAGRRGGGAYGFEGFVARARGNAVDGLADYWLDKTRRALDAERTLANAGIRLRYEDLVTEPQAALERLFDFLGLTPQAAMLDSIFTTPHVVGPGDSKILTTTGIHTDSIGHGARLAMERLSDDRRRDIDALHAELGYPPIASAP